MEESEIQLNEKKQRFESITEGKLSVVEFQPVDRDTLALTHTEVHPELEGKGVASALLEGVLRQVEQQQQFIVPVCPFVTTYIKRHPEWERLVSKTHPAADF